MVVCAARNHLVALVGHSLGHGCGVFLHLVLVFLILGSESLAEGHCLGRNHMLQRAALNAGEHGGIEQRRHFAHFALLGCLTPGIVEVLAHEDHAAARTAEGLVGCGGDDMRVFQRIVEQSGGNQTGGVSHVDHEDGAYLIGNLTHAGIIPFTRIGARAAHNQLGMCAVGYFGHLVVINEAGVLLHIVTYGIEHKAREINRASVAQVTAVIQVHTHEGVARTEHRHEHRHVGLRARVGLHIGILGIEDSLQTVDGEVFGLVHNLAAAIVAVAGIAFGILVGKA